MALKRANNEGTLYFRHNRNRWCAQVSLDGRRLTMRNSPAKLAIGEARIQASKPRLKKAMQARRREYSAGCS